jgi:hypothetical protein
MPETFPSKVPIIDAASWLSEKLSRKITVNFLIELYGEGGIQLMRYAPDIATQHELLKLDPKEGHNEYRTNWYVPRDELMVFAETEIGSNTVSSEEKHAFSKWLRQEKTILKAITEAGLDPMKFPKWVQGKGTQKAAIRQQLIESRPNLFRRSSFDKAWGRLRSEGRIVDESVA